MLHLPETAHLYVLLNCAQFNQKTYLEPELESYLIQTLMRYSEMVETNDYSELNSQYGLEDVNSDIEHDYLKEIADYCLICTGLMSDHFTFEETSFERLQEVGQSAFTMLSDHLRTEDNIYKKLSNNFNRLVEILNYSQYLMETDSDVFPEYNITDKDCFFIEKGNNTSSTNIRYH